MVAVYECCKKHAGEVWVSLQIAVKSRAKKSNHALTGMDGRRNGVSRGDHAKELKPSGHGLTGRGAALRIRWEAWV